MLPSRRLVFPLRSPARSFGKKKPFEFLGVKRRRRVRKPAGRHLQIQERARREADRQARNVRWDRLLQARIQHVEWQIFALWVSCVADVEGSIPTCMRDILETRCPGFLDYEASYRRDHPKEEPFLWLRLWEWLQCNFFADAKREGWLDAVAYYALRDPVAWLASEYCVMCRREWKRQRPSSYPSFQEWRQAAANWEPPPEAYTRQVYKAWRRVHPERLAQAVRRYIDWEAFVYWTRPALEDEAEFPPVVQDSLRERCPGFLEYDATLRRAERAEEFRSWQRLIKWGIDHFFADAKREGWFDVIIFSARQHPRAARAAEYCVRCEAQWLTGIPTPYPAFNEWRRAADDYVVDPSEAEW